MDKNEIKESRNEVSRIVKKPVENIYGLSSLYRVFWARVIDLLFVAIPAIVVNWAWSLPDPEIWEDNGKLVAHNLDAWSHAEEIHIIVTLAVALAAILIFLVIIPSFTKGTTIGKWLCGIRLKRSKGDKQVKWYMLLARESYFLLVPWVIAIIFEVITWAILISGSHTEENYVAKIINQISIILYFLWFIFLLVTIKAQDEHQCGIDMAFGLVVVYKEPIKQIVKEEVVTEKSLILTDQPGNLSKDNLDELRNDEERKFSKSISLEDLDLEVNKDQIESKKKKDEETKKIEHDDDKKNKGEKK